MYPLEFVPVLSGRYRPLLQKVAKCKKYNKFKDFAFNTLAFQKVTNMTFKYSNFRALKSVNPKSSGGSAPWTPGRGPKAGPWTPPKIGSRLRARYVRSAHMFAPQKIGSRLRARYVRSAHMFAQKKSDPSNSKKSARASRSLCALRAHVCPPP